MSKVVAFGTRRQDQDVVRGFGGRGLDDAPFGVDRDHFLQKDGDVLLPAEDAAEGEGNVAGGKAARRDLIEQRLEEVEVSLVDQRDFNGDAAQSLRHVQSTETAADDQDSKQWTVRGQWAFIRG